MKLKLFNKNRSRAIQINVTKHNKSMNTFTNYNYYKTGLSKNN